MVALTTSSLLPPIPIELAVVYKFTWCELKIGQNTTTTPVQQVSIAGVHSSRTSIISLPQCRPWVCARHTVRPRARRLCFLPHVHGQRRKKSKGDCSKTAFKLADSNRHHALISARNFKTQQDVKPHPEFMCFIVWAKNNREDMKFEPTSP